jgi:hypothetical protein
VGEDDEMEEWLFGDVHQILDDGIFVFVVERVGNVVKRKAKT